MIKQQLHLKATYFTWSIITSLFLRLALGELYAQTPTDAIMMNAQEVCFLVDYQDGSFDEYWEGSRLRSNETIATVNRESINSMMAIGIFKNLNGYLGLPYVRTESSVPNGGRFAGAEGFQDFSVALKYRIFNQKIKDSQLTLLSAASFSTPATNYLSDYMPYSLGLGTPQFALRGIAQYQLKSNLYLRGMGGYMWRGYTEAERDYYYNNGSYYTAWMDVPNAWNGELVLGKWFFENSLKMELNYSILRSTSGDDTRAYNAAQPTNKIQSDQVGVTLQYYTPFIKGLGAVANFNQVVDGRNTAKIANVSLGLTYQFSFSDKTNTLTDVN